MDNIFVDAKTLAQFANLQSSADAEVFRNQVDPNFLPQEIWRTAAVSITPGKETVMQTAMAMETPQGWQALQTAVRHAWQTRFALDESVQLVTFVERFSKQAQLMNEFVRMSNEKIMSTVLPEAQVWPFQRAVMFLTIDSWRARFCPRCSKAFVAEKSQSRYCSEKCFRESRKGTKRKWWSANGEEWRSGREKKSKGAKTRRKK